ncbi:MAG: hypothetical protein KAS75_05790 [Planctomycetes bacterium]|nr:hypothetical protein [Planctomycetota bacterium]
MRNDKGDGITIRRPDLCFAGLKEYFSTALRFGRDDEGRVALGSTGSPQVGRDDKEIRMGERRKSSCKIGVWV